MIELLIAISTFCTLSSGSQTEKCRWQVTQCVLKELEGPVGKSQQRSNQEYALEKCVRERVCETSVGSTGCSKNMAR